MFSMGPDSSARRAETAAWPQTCDVTSAAIRTGGWRMFPCANAVAAKKVDARKAEACMLGYELKIVDWVSCDERQKQNE